MAQHSTSKKFAAAATLTCLTCSQGLLMEVRPTSVAKHSLLYLPHCFHQHARLVLMDRAVHTGCGPGGS
jgi:hypothetical protein